MNLIPETKYSHFRHCPQPGRKRTWDNRAWETKSKASTWTRLKKYYIALAARARGRKKFFRPFPLPTQESTAKQFNISRVWINKCSMMLRNFKGYDSLAAEGIALAAGHNEFGHPRVFVIDAYHAARTKCRYLYFYQKQPTDPTYCEAKHRFKISHSQVRQNQRIDKELFLWLIRVAFSVLDFLCKVKGSNDQVLRTYLGMIRPQERPDSALAPPEAHVEPLDFVTDPKILRLRRFKERLRRSKLLFKADECGVSSSNFEDITGNQPLSPKEEQQAANAAYFSKRASAFRQKLRMA